MKFLSKSTLAVVGAVVLFSMILFGFTFSIIMHYIEVQEIGAKFTQVFWIDLNARLIVKTLTFIVLWFFVLINLFSVRKNLLTTNPYFEFLKNCLWVYLISLLIALIFFNWISGSMCATVLPFFNSEHFNLNDPYFFNDIGYYIFQRPFIMSVIYALMHIILISIFTNIFSYFIIYSTYDFYDLKSLAKNHKIITQFVVNIIAYFITKAASYKFEAENLLFRHNKDFDGMNYIGMQIWTNYYRIVPFLLIIIVLLTIYFSLKKKHIKSLICIAIFPVFWFLTGLTAYSIQILVVSPNELSIESKYLENNIKFTREAYKLSQIHENDFQVKYDLSHQDIDNNIETINNIRIADRQQTLKSMNQLQGLRNYYTFSDANIVNYFLNGKDTAVMLSARELNTEQLNNQTKSNYINYRMKYTHGCGVVMNPVNKITDQGQPYFIIKDLPTRSIDDAPIISQPRIYFGEHTDHYVIVNTKGKELDDIEGSYSYTGNGGIKLNILTKFLFAIRYADFNLLISSQIQRDSKILMNRQIIERIKKVFSHFEYDEDAHMLIDSNGRLKWIVDAYSVTERFPCAQKHEKYNYIRNSVKVVVDAYDGDVKFYIIDKNEPIAKAYSKIFPDVFEKEALPGDLASHMRYPKKLFKIQAEMLKKYHLSEPSDFYQNKVVWAFCKEKYQSDNQHDVEPYYNMMKINATGQQNLKEGTSKEELVIMIPYTLINKDNMVSWLACRCNANNYGELVLYKFPLSENLYGTYQIENRIDSNPDISREMTLWGQRGSTVIRGNILVVPIENSILYIEPVYISSGQDSALPEMKQVIVAYSDKIVMKQTLGEALTALFGFKNTPSTVVPTLSSKEIIQQASEIYNNMSEDLKNLDWRLFGEHFNALGNAIQEIKNREQLQNSDITPPNDTR